MTRSITLTITLPDRGVRQRALRAADLLEVFAQELRDECKNGPIVSAPGHKTSMALDTLEVTDARIS